MSVSSLQRNNSFTPLSKKSLENKSVIYSSYFLTQNLLQILDHIVNECSLDTISTTSSTFIDGMTTSTEDLEEVYSLIIARHQQIFEVRERFRLFIESFKLQELLYSDLASLSMHIFENGTYQVQSSGSVDDGISGTYFLTDKNGNPRFVAKPFDEEAGCINNPKNIAGLTMDHPFRDDMPLYHSAMREALAYQIALQIGVDAIAPKTVLAIIQADQFHDVSDWMSVEDRETYLEKCGPADREKLCSIQEYVPNSKHLYEIIGTLESAGLTGEEMAARFDQDDFEDVNILMWTTYDTDGHLGNILAYLKAIDASGHAIFGIKKIDNGLAFPDKNRQLRNGLLELNNSQRPLSDAAKTKIANIDVDALADQLKMYGLESAIPALKERIPFLQGVVA